MAKSTAENAELTLATESKAIPGPPLRGGLPRKKPYYPRPSRKKSPPDQRRSVERHLYLTPEYDEYFRSKAEG